MKKFIKKVMKWLGTTKILSIPRRCLERILVIYFKSKDVVLISINPDSSGALRLIRQIKQEVDMALGDLEAYQIYTAVKKTEKIKGEIAEVGVYKGGSAKLICEATKKQVHIFDTFEGLPEISEYDNPKEFKKEDFFASLESVKNYLKNYSNISFYKGFFPSTAEPIKNKIFSFVHLDVDIYESTLDCLKFFYPRMQGGG